jgi:hypothetical protein
MPLYERLGLKCTPLENLTPTNSQVSKQFKHASRMQLFVHRGNLDPDEVKDETDSMYGPGVRGSFGVSSFM